QNLTVPPAESIVRTASTAGQYTLASTYPSKPRSRALGRGVFTRLPLRNWGFVVLLGILQALLLLALDHAGQHAFSLPGFIMIVVMLALTVFFAAGLKAGRRSAKHFVLGAVHGAVQVGLGVGALQLWRQLPFDGWSWPLPLVTTALFAGPIL